MSNRRQQHRNQRESNTREKRELEQENRRLKREVARLRKEIEKSSSEGFDDEVAEEQPKLPKLKCPNCKGTELHSITTPSGKTRHTCKPCGWRGAI